LTLASGTRLGPFEILSLLGAGGMGEVYKAKDTRLGRDVAIKVLSSAIASSPEHLRRFELEARSASALSDPHIVTVYDVGEQNGIHYFASELVEGGDLRSRLGADGIPIRKTIEIAEQIASGLASAHEKGITHRDLKPENILITKAGRAKIADFGLAKLAETPDSGLSQMPTADRIETTEGVVMGTVSYMSPEQAAGRKIDYRSDQFSFGLILYEMLTGKLAFRRDTSGETLAAILRDEPAPIAESNPAAPSPLVWIVERCLAKDPEERYSSTRDLAREISNVRRHISDVTSVSGTAAVRTRGRSRERIAWALAGAAIASAIGVGWILWRGMAPPASARVVRASVLAPEGTILESRWPVAGPVAVSPDGTTIVFSARKGEGLGQLWVRSLDEASARPLAGTDGATMPFWSPDGKFIGFASAEKLKKIGVNGGPVFTLCDIADSRGATWNRDNVILFTPSGLGPVFSVSASGGSPVAVTELDSKAGETTHRFPFFLPDGKHFLFLVRSTGVGHEPAIKVGALGSRASRKLVDAASNAVYASGHLLYVRQGSLVVQAFDPDRLEVSGDVTPLIEDIRMDDRFALAVFSASTNGVLAFQRGKAVTQSQLKWLDRSGKDLGPVGEPAEYFNGGFVALSPDGTRAAVSILDPGTGLAGVWVVDTRDGTRTRASASTLDAYSPVWSPDGSRLAFRRGAPPSMVAAKSDMVIRSLAGAGLEQLVGTASDALQSPNSWSPDGRYLLYEVGPGRLTHLFAQPLARGSALPLALSQGHDDEGSFSPDGRLVAYVSAESGRREIYVAAFPGPGGKWQVSQNGGTEPRWRADGKELFYFAPDNRLMAAQVKVGNGAFQVGGIVPLFQSHAMGWGWRYDVSKDGQRFLVSTALPDSSSPDITLIENWTEMLKKK
jgi:Tol biopolymer transport system component